MHKKFSVVLPNENGLFSSNITLKDYADILIKNITI